MKLASPFSPMDIENQRFMALSGIHAWAHSALRQIDRVEEAIKRMIQAITSRHDRTRVVDHVAEHKNMITAQRDLHSDKHFFLIAANQLIEHISWAKSIEYPPGFLEHAIFARIETFARETKNLRDMHEHVVEYMKGDGRKPDLWIFDGEDGTSDASSLVDSRIGGILDWNMLKPHLVELLAVLPPHYYPERKS